MEDADASNELTEKYNVFYFFRNICSPLLAELFAKKLKNSKFIQEELAKDRESTISKTLYDTLQKVNKRGRRNANKKCSGKTQPKGTTSGTTQINNIEDYQQILKQVQTEELVRKGEASETVTQLRRLDVKFLLCILINHEFQFPHNSKVRRALEKLLELRNSSTHRDKDNKLLIKLWEEAEHLHTCLGRDTASFKKMKEYICFPLDSCYQKLKDVQQEIIASHQMPHHHHHPVQLTLLKECKEVLSGPSANMFRREYCQPGETVENLVDFLVQKQVSSCQEPRPIVLYGECGAGKSSILHSLVHNITKEQAFKNFLMVVKVDVSITNTKEEFWEQLFGHLTKLSPQAVQKHGSEDVRGVLSRYTNRFLFLMDHNLQDTKMLNRLIPFMDRGTWVLSYQGVPEPSTSFHVLKVAPLSEEQVHQVLQGITMSEEYKEQVSEFYKKCEYKEILKTPDMVHIFAEICLELRSCVPFYMLIQNYIYKKVHRTKESEAKLTELGEKAFHTIKMNKKYYPCSSLDDLKSVSQPFLDHDPSKGYFFKYRKVEDYLAAKYIVTYPEVACQSWLSQATLFKTVFHITCALWREQGNGIQTNLHFIRVYLEKLFENDGPQKNRGKKRKWNEANSEVEDATNKNIFQKWKKNKGKKRKWKEANSEEEDATSKNIFQKWIFLSNIAKDNKSSQDILRLLADLLTCYHTWLFKFTPLTEDLIDSLSLVLRHITLTKELTIKIQSDTNVEILSHLWRMLSSHPGLWSNTCVHLAIRYTESNVAKYEPLLAEFCTTIYNTTAPLYITKYTGPLLCTKTPQFFECSSMTKLNMLDVYICDLTSLCKALEQQQNLRSITVRLRLKVVETEILNTLRIKLFPSFPPALTVTYFEGLQILLDSFEHPESLCSLKIYEVYIHKKFTLDLTRFTKLEFLSIRFDQKGSEEKVSLLPLKKWTSHLVQHLHLPTHVGRLLMRNLSFFDDSTASDLVKYFKKVTFQRLLLLDTKFSMSTFKDILQNLVTSSSTADNKESPADPPKKVVKHKRLEKAERETKRQNKPEGKELVISSEAVLFKNFQSSTKDWENAYHSLVSLVKEVYLYQILSINYSGTNVAIRKDMCGDLFVQCPLPFLDDEMAQHPERQLELGPVMEALALAQVISLNNTHLSYDGALYLLKHLKGRMENFGRIEPFRLTIFSCLLCNCSMSVEEVQHNFSKEIENDDSLQQFNFTCSCEKRCNFFKKACDGSIYFNNQLIKRSIQRTK